MKNLNISQPAIRGLLHAAGAILYIFAISLFLDKGEAFFGSNLPNLFGPILILSLLVVSAAIMAILFFLKPVMLLIEKQSREAVLLLAFTMGWFVFLVAALFLVVALF
ncbi:MAG: hypothetical protein UX09_C0047G0001 [Candidatus Uhrbacteria bacterium GW2011_GWE2_45_35]|uniref:Uncharacterized protein n=2 Tax=Candidatus Uhriibacteriota TaxID=1752732 RepID=A0A0G1JCS1_9BACT|nr:MAG: hypothetical protein UW63_C0059G0001 [Candidatus Uhrbacteria bacterium GW2011_GWF2_44_350]KKU06602.1 MAG: hypothetical protein UX09_C0047G0001 [Candidatus Uhrbacteria bacterium GW2011_GWE2_45_35]